MNKDDNKSGATGGNPSGALNSSALLDSSNQLQSINEEGESGGGGADGPQLPTAAHLGRNTPGRQSKEFTAKLHKVSFPNFKKLKDKESKASKSSSSSSGGSIQMSEMGSKKDHLQQQQQQDSHGSSGGGGGLASIAPMKRASILKDKLINRNSVPSDAMDGGGGGGVDKVALKMKNISLDSGTASSSSSSAGVVAGGLVLGASTGHNSNSNHSFDLTESSSDPIENSIATRPSILPLDLDKGGLINGGAANGNGNGNSNVQVYQL